MSAAGAAHRLALSALRALAEHGARTGWHASPAGPLRYAVRGPPGAPDLVVLHGLGDSLAGWARVAPLLSRTRRVHLLDLPGHGLSAAPPDWKLETLTAAVAHYVATLRAPRIVGHSLGGWIAVRVAARTRASQLALVNPAGAPLGGAAWEPFRALVSATTREGARDYLRRAFFRPPLALRAFPGEVIRAMREPACLGVLDALAADDFLRAAELRATPALLLLGEADRLLPAACAAWFRDALGASTSLPATGHLPHLESPRALAERLSEFL